jgi:hypothetical protein
MAWRPTQHLLEGELDNTSPGKVTGWMRFAGMNNKVTFDLKGDFHRDIRGAGIRLCSSGASADVAEAARSMQGFAQHQTGKVGDITAGLPPRDYVAYPYVEWYGDENGRVVIELEGDQVTVIGQPMPAMESYPVSREEQARNMAEFLGGLARKLNVPPERAVCVGASGTLQTGQARSTRPGRTRLLTKAARKMLPPLGSQDGLDGKAVAYVKFFTPDAGWTWWATEGGPEGDDFMFFGLVEGFEKELGYFGLAELQSARGPMGLPVERDLHWKPKTLKEIAPELFEDVPNEEAKP